LIFHRSFNDRPKMDFQLILLRAQAQQGMLWMLEF
jgi:hypothetical protein